MKPIIKKLRHHAYALEDKQRDKVLSIAVDLEKYLASPSDEWCGDKLFYDRRDAAEAAIKYCELRQQRAKDAAVEYAKRDKQIKRFETKRAKDIIVNVQDYEQEQDEGFAEYVSPGINSIGVSLEFLVYEKNMSDHGLVRDRSPDPLSQLIQKEMAEIVADWLRKYFDEEEQLIIYEAWDRYAFEDFDFKFNSDRFEGRFLPNQILRAQEKMYTYTPNLLRALAA